MTFVVFLTKNPTRKSKLKAYLLVKFWLITYSTGRVDLLDSKHDKKKKMTKYTLITKIADISEVKSPRNVCFSQAHTHIEQDGNS